MSDILRFNTQVALMFKQVLPQKDDICESHRDVTEFYFIFRFSYLLFSFVFLSV